MRKILLFTFYNSNNLGDILIAKNVTELFEYKFDCVHCDIINGQEIDVENWHLCLEQNKKYIERKDNLKSKILNIPFLRSAISYLKCYIDKINYGVSYTDAELAVFAGGNSLMELLVFPSNTTRFYRIVKKLKQNKKKVAFCFAGVGPFKTEWSKRIVRKILKLVDFISVRDNASYDIVKSFVPEKEVEIWRDPVLLEEHNVVCELNKSFGINVYFGPDKELHSGVKKGFIQLVKNLRESHSDYTIKLFSSELTDIEHILSVKKSFICDNMVVVENIQNTRQLFELYESVDVVLGTRMHTIITSMISNKPVASISWQPKVTSLMECFENQKYNFDLAYFARNPNEITNALIECLENREIIIDKNQKKLFAIRKETKEKIENFALRM